MLNEKHDDQFVDNLMGFWLQNKKVLLGIFLTIVTGISVHSYSNYRFQQYLLAASEHYQTVVDAINRQDEVSVQHTVNILQKDYKKSPYAALATMSLGSYLMKNNKIEDAAQQVDWLAQKASVPIIKSLAFFKKAELAYLNQDYQGSLTALKELNDDSLVIMKEHLEAKNYAQLHEIDKALAQYEHLLERDNLDEAHKAILVAEYNYLVLTQPS
jgi:predicted negative regulator of RcsB-dependent stress response